MRRTILVVSAAMLSGCLVPKDQYDMMAAEAARRGKDAEDAKSNAAAFEKRLGEMQVELDAEKQRREQLEKVVAETEQRLTDKEAERRALEEKNAELTALNQELSKSSQKLAEAKAELEKKSSEYEDLATSLKSEIQAGKIELSELKGKMTVKLKDKVLFSSGSAKLGKEGEAALEKVAGTLKDMKGRMIRVEGHTDSEPVPADGPFASNWELSVARAMAVVSYLQTHGVDPTKLSAAGYGQFQPVAPNDTAEHRSLNRRIEIVLAAADGAAAPAAPIEKVKAPVEKTKTKAKATKGK